ncbi:MAG: hypothetical protein JST87_11930 [Bacteroidetes bacterium]|nr:hypothetical protein [Bacteroidota bacterium]MBS1936010.1 hypothetical protein [Bacteroidota bacterium]
MKKLFIPVICVVMAACNNSNSYKKADDAQEAGREFIRGSLDGDYDKARFYLYADSTNKFLLDSWKSSYDRLSAEEKQKYKDADIIVLNVHPENDSVTTYKYFNSYKKDTTTLKVLRIEGYWFVDLKEMIK